MDYVKHILDQSKKSDEFNLHRRIDGESVVQLLAEIQKSYPHLRVGQIVEDALFELDGDVDGFYVENSDLVIGLIRFKLRLEGGMEK